MKQIRRPGFTFVELLTASIIISVLLIVVAQMLTLVIDQARVNQRRLAAGEFAASVMEVVTAQPFEAVDAMALELPEVRDLLEPRLEKNWQLHLEVNETQKPRAGKRLRLSILWKHAPAHQRPLIITAWKFSERQP